MSEMSQQTTQKSRNTVTVEWISVQDKMPDDYEECIYYVPTEPEGERVIPGQYISRDHLFSIGYGPTACPEGRVTHWMPLPPEPEHCQD